jgi:hypothetical protein
MQEPFQRPSDVALDIEVEHPSHEPQADGERAFRNFKRYFVAALRQVGQNVILDACRANLKYDRHPPGAVVPTGVEEGKHRSLYPGHFDR